MKDLVGKKIYGFEFSGGPGYAYAMKDLVGKIGVIKTQYEKSCQVQFPRGGIWSYPYPDIIEHLVDKEDERTIDELLTEMKQLISRI